MSHQLQGPRAGLINREFDEAFLETIVHEPERLLEISHEEYIRKAGSEGIELILWLVMRAHSAGMSRGCTDFTTCRRRIQRSAISFSPSSDFWRKACCRIKITKRFAV